MEKCQRRDALRFPALRPCIVALGFNVWVVEAGNFFGGEIRPGVNPIASQGCLSYTPETVSNLGDLSNHRPNRPRDLPGPGKVIASQKNGLWNIEPVAVLQSALHSLRPIKNIPGQQHDLR
jgi:hypothetical protein